MNQLFRLTILILLLCSVSLKGQISFTQVPKEGAFLARDLNKNTARYDIEGIVTDPAYTTITFEVYRNNYLERTYRMNLQFLNGRAQFKRPITLTAGKFTYSIKYILKGSTVYSQQINNLMVGDVYLIQGQSNSVANNFSGAGIHSDAFKDKYIRSFGNSSTNKNTCFADSFWHQAIGDAAYQSGSVGQWGLVMARSLLDSFGIPICILNGGVGGTRSDLHQRDPTNPENLNTIYGRLLSRVRRAQLTDKVRGIFFYQGESDRSFAIKHDTNIRNLHRFWSEDFPNFEKLFIVQVRNGCGNPSMQLREFQRQFEFSLPNCQTISSNGLNGHDGCHFKFEKGYKELGLQIAALAARDFYNSTHRTNIDPPNLQDCFYSDASKKEITLRLTHPQDMVFTDPGFYRLFMIEGDPSVEITQGEIKNNAIVLTLNKSSCSITGLSYDGLSRVQPWVKNKIGTALISFYNQAIKYHKVLNEYSGCKNSSLFIGEDSIAGSQYSWTRLLTKDTFSTSKISIKGKERELFSLIIKYSKSSCKENDTLRVKLIPDEVQIPKLGNDTSLCFGDTFKTNIDSIQFPICFWNYRSEFIKGHRFEASRSGEAILNVQSKAECAYKDTLNILFYKAKVKLPEDFAICSGADTLLKTPRSYSAYTWNGTSAGRSYTMPAGELILTVEDSFGCIASDTLTITEHPPIALPKLKPIPCENSFVTLPKPTGFSRWTYNSQVIIDGLNVYSNKNYPIGLIDSFGCSYTDTIRTSEYPEPKYSLGKDTGFCKNDTLQLLLPPNMEEYTVNGKKQNGNALTIFQAGSYYTSVTNSNGCSSSDSLFIEEYEQPSLNHFRDTLVCAKEPIVYKLEPNLNYFINSELVSNDYIFKDSGIYVIDALNTNGCLQSKTIRIEYKPCINTTHSLQTNPILIFPNPSKGAINIHATLNQNKPISLFDINGRKVYQSTFIGKSHSIEAHRFRKGMYVLKIKAECFKVLLL